jgi:hypothetical protein
MNIETAFISAFSSIIGGLIGSYLTYYFNVKAKKNEAMLHFKEEKYSQLIVLLQGFVGQTVSSDLKKAFFKEQYKSWLYCSDEVVITINKMISLIKRANGNSPNPHEGQKVIGDIVLAMRKDLRGKTNLNNTDFIYTDVLD